MTISRLPSRRRGRPALYVIVVAGLLAAVCAQNAAGSSNEARPRSSLPDTLTWQIRTLDSTGDVGAEVSLAVVNGRPAVAYYDVTRGDLKYVRANDAAGPSWGTLRTLDSAGDVGSYTSLALNTAGGRI